jgi:hypothetical protein
MISSLSIYFISIADNIRDVITVVSVFSVLIGIVGLTGYIVCLCSDDDCAENIPIFRKILKSCIVAICISSLMSIVVPSSKSLAAIIIIPKIVNNEKVQDITDNTLNILQSLTVKWVNDLNSNKEKTEQKEIK